MKVLITRPLEDTPALRDALAERGHDTLIEPLLRIVPRPAAATPINLGHVQALVFTSANGVRVFADRHPERDFPVFTVGNATAETARSAGFENITSAGCDVDSLAALVREELTPADGCLFQPAASVLAGDLKKALEAGGFELRRQVLYDAVPAERLSERTVTALRGGRIGAVALYSPRTAETFERLVNQESLARCLETCLALCLSPAVEAKISALPWQEVRVAAAPNQKSLLACLDGTGQAGKKYKKG